MQISLSIVSWASNKSYKHLIRTTVGLNSVNVTSSWQQSPLVSDRLIHHHCMCTYMCTDCSPAHDLLNVSCRRNGAARSFKRSWPGNHQSIKAPIPRGQPQQSTSSHGGWLPAQLRCSAVLFGRCCCASHERKASRRTSNLSIGKWTRAESLL